MMLLSATLVSGFAPTPVPCEPMCDWSTHDFKLVGKEMACVARDPDVDEYLFYTMEVGKCTVKSGNTTHAVFDIDVINGISFANAPWHAAEKKNAMGARSAQSTADNAWSQRGKSTGK